MTAAVATRLLVNMEYTGRYSAFDNVPDTHALVVGWETGTSTGATNWEPLVPESRHLEAVEYLDDRRIWWLDREAGPAGYALVSQRSTTASRSKAEIAKTPIEDRKTTDVLDPVAIADRLHRWLGLTVDDLAAIAGIARTTIHYWHRANARPRPATVRRLLRAYALVQALIAQGGVDVTATWLRSGAPSPLDLLKTGDYETVEDMVAAKLFDAAERQPDYAAYMPESSDEVSIIAPQMPSLRRAPRQPRRGRLSR